MKSKKLAIVLFVLAIVTVLSAGTLAIYTTRLEDLPTTTVTAKQFVLDANVANTESFTFKLAPGEAMTTGDIVITNTDGQNTSEVPMDLRITPAGNLTDLTNFMAAMPGVKIDLLQNGAVVASWTEANLADLGNGESNYDVINAFAASVASEQVYQLRVTWVDDDPTNAASIAEQVSAAANNNSGSFVLYVKGTQHVEAAA